MAEDGVLHKILDKSMVGTAINEGYDAIGRGIEKNKAKKAAGESPAAPGASSKSVTKKEDKNHESRTGRREGETQREADRRNTANAERKEAAANPPPVVPTKTPEEIAAEEASRKLAADQTAASRGIGMTGDTNLNPTGAAYVPLADPIAEQQRVAQDFANQQANLVAQQQAGIAGQQAAMAGRASGLNKGQAALGAGQAATGQLANTFNQQQQAGVANYNQQQTINNQADQAAADLQMQKDQLAQQKKKDLWGGIGSFVGNLFSDEGMKDISPATDVHSILAKIKPIDYTYKPGNGPTPGTNDQQPRVGVTAQSLENSPLAAAVKTDPASGNKMIDNNELTPMLLNLVAQLAKEVAQIKRG